MPHEPAARPQTATRLLRGGQRVVTTITVKVDVDPDADRIAVWKEGIGWVEMDRGWFSCLMDVARHAVEFTHMANEAADHDRLPPHPDDLACCMGISRRLTTAESQMFDAVAEFRRAS